MKRKSFGCFILLVLMTMLVLMACGTEDTGTSMPDQVIDVAQQGETEPQLGEETAQDMPIKEEASNQLIADTKPSAGIGETKSQSQNEEKAVQTASTGQKPAVQSQAHEKKEFVTLRVTRDFGTETIFNKKVEIKKDGTVLDILNANLDIETDFDGGFIKGINGLISDKGGLSGKRTDWFFYVNGICTDAGADAYSLKPGETVWWDYHLWENMGSANSAVIGNYPEPFIHGYGGKVGVTTVLSTPEKSELTEKLKKALAGKGVKTVNVSGIDEEKLNKRKGPLIVIGEWSELSQFKWLEDFNKAYRKTGTGAHFTDRGLELIKYNGEVDHMVSGSVGVITATGSGLGDETPLWLIAGTDAEGLEQAINLLVNNPEKISGMYSGAIVSGKITRLPIQ